MNIIGDIAGQYDVFLRLLKKMPDDDVLSVGDMIDRGPKSKEVVEWFMKNGKAVLGNHEHLMLAELRGTLYYYGNMWLYNGGAATLQSFDGTIPEEVLTWIEHLPLYEKIGDVLVSHSFVGYWQTPEEACDLGKNMAERGENTIIWNRGEPERRDEYSMQIAGHNGDWGHREFRDRNGLYAIGIDTSGQKKLTGIHIPSYTVYQEDF